MRKLHSGCDCRTCTSGNSHFVFLMCNSSWGQIVWQCASLWCGETRADGALERGGRTAPGREGASRGCADKAGAAQAPRCRQRHHSTPANQNASGGRSVEWRLIIAATDLSSCTAGNACLRARRRLPSRSGDAAGGWRREPHLRPQRLLFEGSGLVKRTTQ